MCACRRELRTTHQIHFVGDFASVIGQDGREVLFDWAGYILAVEIISATFRASVDVI